MEHENKLSPFQTSKFSTHNAHTPSVQLPNYEITTLSHHTHMKILQFKSAQKEKFNNLIAYHILTLLDFIPCVWDLFFLCELMGKFNSLFDFWLPTRKDLFSPVDITQHSMFVACAHTDDSCNLIIVWVEKFPFENAFKHTKFLRIAICGEL